MSRNKDPAVLFYTADFLADTTLWSYEELGRYIKLLCMQHLNGGISKTDFETVAEEHKRIIDKFDLSEDGLYRNKRMKEEAEKRRLYSESRRKNISSRYEDKPTYVEHMKHTCTTHVLHMGNENKNINIIKDVITYLNNKLGTKYLYESEDVIKDIKNRLEEGFTYEDFVTVIDKKYEEWHGTDMERFLRTDVLFGEKFQQYLNQIDKPHSQSKNQRYGDFDPEDAMQRAIARSFGKKEGGDDPI